MTETALSRSNKSYRTNRSFFPSFTNSSTTIVIGPHTLPASDGRSLTWLVSGRVVAFVLRFFSGHVLALIGLCISNPSRIKRRWTELRSRHDERSAGLTRDLGIHGLNQGSDIAIAKCIGLEAARIVGMMRHVIGADRT